MRNKANLQRAGKRQLLASCETKPNLGEVGRLGYRVKMGCGSLVMVNAGPFGCRTRLHAMKRT